MTLDNLTDKQIELLSWRKQMEKRTARILRTDPDLSYEDRRVLTEMLALSKATDNETFLEEYRLSPDSKIEGAGEDSPDGFFPE